MSTLEASVCLPAVPDFDPLVFSYPSLFFLFPFGSNPVMDLRRISGCKVLTPLHCLRMTKHLSRLLQNDLLAGPSPFLRKSRLRLSPSPSPSPPGNPPPCSLQLAFQYRREIPVGLPKANLGSIFC